MCYFHSEKFLTAELFGKTNVIIIIIYCTIYLLKAFPPYNHPPPPPFHFCCFLLACLLHSFFLAKKKFILEMTAMQGSTFGTFYHSWYGCTHFDLLSPETLVNVAHCIGYTISIPEVDFVFIV